VAVRPKQIQYLWI